jgi:hypothetical protein
MLKINSAKQTAEGSKNPQRRKPAICSILEWIITSVDSLLHKPVRGNVL